MKEQITFKELSDLWKSLLASDTLAEYIDSRFSIYKNLGYEVSAFKSLSAIYDKDNNAVIPINRGVYHELKTCFQMDHYLSTLEDKFCHKQDQEMPDSKIFFPM